MVVLETPLIKFNNPPIVEKLMGIRFEPTCQWSISLSEIFRQHIIEDFPEFSIQPALVDIGLSVLILQQSTNIEDSIRYWFNSKHRKKLIQIQRDRFLYNWLQPTTHEEYPHHETVRLDFKNSWQKFCDTFTEEKIDLPVVKSCEITYIDQLEEGREWHNSFDLSRIIKYWNGSSSNFLNSTPDLTTIQMVYSLPELEGKLNITLQPAVRQHDSKEIFQITSTLVGIPASQDIDDILSWFDMGREYIFRYFVDLTTEEMHELWDKRS